LENARGEIGERTWRNYRSDANDPGRAVFMTRLPKLRFGGEVTRTTMPILRGPTRLPVAFG
jgi:hypothetical protein